MASRVFLLQNNHNLEIIGHLPFTLALIPQNHARVCTISSNLFFATELFQDKWKVLYCRSVDFTTYLARNESTAALAVRTCRAMLHSRVNLEGKKAQKKKKNADKFLLLLLLPLVSGMSGFLSFSHCTQMDQKYLTKSLLNSRGFANFREFSARVKFWENKGAAASAFHLDRFLGTLSSIFGKCWNIMVSDSKVRDNTHIRTHVALGASLLLWDTYNYRAANSARG